MLLPMIVHGKRAKGCCSHNIILATQLAQFPFVETI